MQVMERGLIARMMVAIYAGYGGERVVAVGREYGCCCGEGAKIFVTFALGE